MSEEQKRAWRYIYDTPAIDVDPDEMERCMDVLRPVWRRLGCDTEILDDLVRTAP